MLKQLGVRIVQVFAKVWAPCKHVWLYGVRLAAQRMSACMNCAVNVLMRLVAPAGIVP